jgi:hypothetical protein
LLALHWDEETTSPQAGARTAAGQIHRPSAPLNHALVLRCQGSILTLLFMSSGNSFTYYSTTGVMSDNRGLRVEREHNE